MTSPIVLLALALLIQEPEGAAAFARGDFPDCYEGDVPRLFDEVVVLTWVRAQDCRREIDAGAPARACRLLEDAAGGMATVNACATSALRYARERGEGYDWDLRNLPNNGRNLVTLITLTGPTINGALSRLDTWRRSHPGSTTPPDPAAH